MLLVRQYELVQQRCIRQQIDVVKDKHIVVHVVTCHAGACSWRVGVFALKAPSGNDVEAGVEQSSPVERMRVALLDYVDVAAFVEVVKVIQKLLQLLRPDLCRDACMAGCQEITPL